MSNHHEYDKNDNAYLQCYNNIVINILYINSMVFKS